MVTALEAIGASIRQFASHFLVSVVANLLAMLLSLPILLLVAVLAYLVRSPSLLPIGIVLAVGVLPNPAAAGVHTIARDLAQGEVIVLRAQRDGFMTYWRRALVMWLLGLAVTAIIVVNVLFYASLARSHASLQPIAAPLELTWLLILLIWLSVSLYVFPLLLQQRVKRGWLVYRNAGIMAMGRPIYALTVTLVWVIILFLSSLTGLVTVFGLTLAALVQQNAFARILPAFELT